MDWTVSRPSDICTDIHIQAKKGDWEQWGLLTSDEHIDNPHSRNDLHKYHLQQAMDRGAFICSFGDFFDGMQGKFDRRSSKNDLLPDVKSTSYLNELTKYGIDYLMPYKDNLAMISEGNHETGVLKHTEYNLTDGLVSHLSMAGSPVVRGPYRGWMRFLFQMSSGSNYISYNVFYTHGSGGGGPVTKGVIQTNRRAAYLRNADIVLSGHVHEQWKVHIPQAEINQRGVEVIRDQIHVQLPTYKEEFANVGNGFHAEKGGPPKPVGAWWVRFYWSPREKKIKFQIIEADA